MVNVPGTQPEECSGVVILKDVPVLYVISIGFPSIVNVAPLKLVPVKVTSVPPCVGTERGKMDEIVGTGMKYVNALALVAVPLGVVTATLLAPAVPAGVFAVILVALTTATLVAATPFTFTLVAPDKFVPVIVNAVPPNVVPELGETDVIVGKTT